MEAKLGHEPYMYHPAHQNWYPPNFRRSTDIESILMMDKLSRDLDKNEWTQGPSLKDTSDVPQSPLPFEHKPPTHRGVDWRTAHEYSLLSDSFCALPFEYNHPTFKKDAQNAAPIEMAQSMPKKEIEKEKARLQNVLDETQKLIELSDATNPGLQTTLEVDNSSAHIPDICTSFIDGVSRNFLIFVVLISYDCLFKVRRFGSF